MKVGIRRQTVEMVSGGSGGGLLLPLAPPGGGGEELETSLIALTEWKWEMGDDE